MSIAKKEYLREIKLIGSNSRNRRDTGIIGYRDYILIFYRDGHGYVDLVDRNLQSICVYANITDIILVNKSQSELLCRYGCSPSPSKTILDTASKALACSSNFAKDSLSDWFWKEVILYSLQE